jgi:hypothetical protein|tara:strand:- start:684 stop:950 length:267 start_codon:yes stop_codon:yes gene_type:complete
MKEDTPNDTVPNFVIKSTKGTALISAVIIAPFVAINMYLYSLAAYRCHQNKYSLPLSLFGIAPIITLISAFALYTLGIAASFWSCHWR